MRPLPNRFLPIGTLSLGALLALALVGCEELGMAPDGSPAASPSPAAGTAAPTVPAASSAPASPAAASPSALPLGSPTAGGNAVTIELVAQNNEFDTDTITVPAGAEVTITLVNEDPVPHNFAVYETEEASEAIYVGDTFTGPGAEETDQFTAPDEPGDYFFRCDVHPEMSGAVNSR